MKQVLHLKCAIDNRTRERLLINRILKHEVHVWGYAYQCEIEFSLFNCWNLANILHLLCNLNAQYAILPYSKIKPNRNTFHFHCVHFLNVFSSKIFLVLFECSILVFSIYIFFILFLENLKQNNYAQLKWNTFKWYWPLDSWFEVLLYFQLALRSFMHGFLLFYCLQWDSLPLWALNNK